MKEALIISLIVLFIHATTWEGHVFAGIKNLVKPEGKLYKPVYGCPICMTPYYGSLVYWIFYSYSLPDYLLTIGAASGISVLFVVAITLRKASLEFIKTKEKKK